MKPCLPLRLRQCPLIPVYFTHAENSTPSLASWGMTSVCCVLCASPSFSEISFLGSVSLSDCMQVRLDFFSPRTEGMEEQGSKECHCLEPACLAPLFSGGLLQRMRQKDTQGDRKTKEIRVFQSLAGDAFVSDWKGNLGSGWDLRVGSHCFAFISDPGVTLCIVHA